jgi:hypothetical protein
VCACIYICIYVHVYISICITSAYMHMYQRLRLRSSHVELQWHVPRCMNAILVCRCNKQGSNVLLSIQFDTNVSQLLGHVIPWSYDPLPSHGELSSSSLNRLSVCLSCLFWLCIPLVVYGRHILCLRCLRVAFFSEKKRGFSNFFRKKIIKKISKKNGPTSVLTRGWRQASDVSPTPPDGLTSAATTKQNTW